MIVVEELDLRNQDDCDVVIKMIGSHLGESRKEHARLSMEKKDCFVVAKDDGKIVACAGYGFSQFHYETWWIGFSVVEEPNRRQGLATRLLDYRLDKIKQKQGRWVMAAVLPPTDRFTKKGFIHLQETPPHRLMLLDLRASEK